MLHKKVHLDDATLRALTGPWCEVFAPLGDRLSNGGSLLGWVPRIRINGVEIYADGFEFHRGERFWLTLGGTTPLSERKLMRENWAQQSVFFTEVLSSFAAGSKGLGVVTHCGSEIGADRSIVPYELDDGILFRASGREVLIFPSDESPSSIAFTCSKYEIAKRTSNARIRWAN